MSSWPSHHDGRKLHEQFPELRSTDIGDFDDRRVTDSTENRRKQTQWQFERHYTNRACNVWSVTVLVVFALQAILLKTVIALNALTFVTMPLAAKMFLGEDFTKRGIIASIVIVVGIVVFLSGG